MNRLYLVLAFLLTQSIYAQSETINSPFLISSAGDTWMTEDYILCFSLGELAIETQLEQNTILTQGFHQEENYQITEIEEHLNNYKINIYPNPTSQTLNIYCNEKSAADINITDIKGHVVKKIKNEMPYNNLSIDLSGLSNGVYFLEIAFSQKEKKVYQIQKFN